MTTTPTLPAKAEPGRRVMLTYYRDLPRPNSEKPGVITGIDLTQPQAVLKVRLDGARSNLYIRPDYEGIRYLDETGPVPELPMGRFQPTRDHAGFEYAYDGVIVVGFEDGDMAAFTADRDKAEAAVSRYLREVAGVDDEESVRDEVRGLRPEWVFFEWEPEDAECDWWMHFTSEGDDQALHVHYLPA